MGIKTISPRERDITGQRFGRLVANCRVTVPENYRAKKPAIRWLFDCDCGGSKEFAKSYVVTGLTTHCGCLNTNNRKGIKLVDESLLDLVPKHELNGAGPKGFGWLVPDKLGEVNINKAADIHDAHYYLIKFVHPLKYPDSIKEAIRKRSKPFFYNISNKKEALEYSNKIFKQNMRLINKVKSPTKIGFYLRKPIIWLYSSCVNRFGGYFL